MKRSKPDPKPDPWVCPWGICNAEQAQQCRAELHPRRGCGGKFPNMNAEQARHAVQPPEATDK